MPSKTISKLNALRHGIYAKSGLLPWEDPEEFADLRDKTFASLKPWNPMLEKMAEQIVNMQWLLIRNQRSGLLYALCEPFGREVMKHKHENDFLEVASKLVSQRDGEIMPIAAAAKLIMSAARNADPKRSKQLLKDIGRKLLHGVNRLANQYTLTHEYFLGLDAQTMKQGECAMKLQAHLLKMIAGYFALEQWLVTSQKVVPKLEVKRSADENDDLSANDV
jgi:hypothetical protein